MRRPSAWRIFTAKATRSPSTGPRRKSRFAFVIHPLSQRHFENVEPLRTISKVAPSPVMDVVEKAVGRTPAQAFARWILKQVLPRPALFNPLLRLGQLTRALLPAGIARKVPPRQAPTPWPGDPLVQ